MATIADFTCPYCHCGIMKEQLGIYDIKYIKKVKPNNLKLSKRFLQAFRRIQEYDEDGLMGLDDFTASQLSEKVNCMQDVIEHPENYEEENLTATLTEDILDFRAHLAEMNKNNKKVIDFLDKKSETLLKELEK